ncbi:PKD domain-containing protein [Candidatus Gracilibacteria bacterium]|nr:PKD domain-containing protein [Candidatus Gracilibacteria bacterium]
MLAYIRYDLYKPNLMRKLLLIVLSIVLTTFCGVGFTSANTTSSDPDYTTFRTIDRGTFNEYRFRMTEQFFALREHFQIQGNLNVSVLRQMLETANTGYNYLPDNLLNQNALRQLAIEIQKGINSPRDEFIYNDILRSLAAYIENVNISQIQGSIEAIPVSGNAPLTSTLRVNAQDPTGTQIQPSNIRWWMNVGGQEIVIGRGVSLNYTFRNEGRYTVFVDVVSSHRNSQGNTDVLPYRGRVDVTVNEQIATLNIKVNSDSVRDNDILKFTPEVANFGLVIDATSSLPSGGARFTQTEWDFGNGIRKTYSGPPKIERARYANEGEYTIRLKLTTNEGKSIETRFEIYVHNPIAKIEVNRREGHIGDRFTFQAKMSGNDRNVSYTWEIIDIERDSVIFQRNEQNFSYIFNDKGRYNVRLRVRKSSGETDQDTRIIAIESRNPIAEYNYNIPERNRPNRVFFDATRSFDPDMTDNARLEYVWYVDGDRVQLENPSLRGSTGFYTFSDVGTYVVTLEVIDPDGLRDMKQEQVRIESILSVNFQAFPRVIQREGVMRFVAEAPEAEVFEWDFGDGRTIGGSQSTVSHTYDRSGTFRVNLRVTDRNNNTNTFSRSVFVANSESPLAFIDTSVGGVELPEFIDSACGGAGAYRVDRVSTIRFDGKESINIDGNTRGLEYSWRIGNNKFATTQSVNHRFDEIGCFPVVLTVRSTTNGRTDRVETFVEAVNLPPTLTSLDIRVQDEFSDPVVIEVTAQGANDPDGVVQSYMWYYYTDIDPEPQDFRATRRGNTTFVIPRVTGNYYFVAILRDNNEERITSEEITNSRHFVTITGDNLNTPIIGLRVDNNSISVGDEVTFNVSAENILNQDISGDATYHWDFNGDGFYNMQTSTPTASYVYRNSGEFFAKVKVSYRGMSSTRNVTINVTNRLRADFGYFSIGNKFIFFDMSSGQVASRQWDMGDGQTRSGNTFTYTYTDGKPQRDVTLRVSEGTKIDEITLSVQNNPRNVLRARQSGIVAFTYPEINNEGDIVLEVSSDRVFVYMGESSEAEAYVIDFDIDLDSNLNGSRDDDEDNKGTPSYLNGSIIEIPLNGFREQTIRLFLKDEEGNVFASEDITIIKEFIEDQTIDPDTIIFDNISEEDRQKLERLKKILSELPQAERLKSLQFVQRLQQNWFDKTEKTRTIIDFESYIFELNLSNENEIIDILESLLVSGQEDQSQLQIIYQALINLVPQEIQCQVETGNCYDNLISKLTDIRQSEDIDYNRELGREILQVIAETDLMTSEQKLDFRAILITLVYRGDIGAIPEDEKQEIIEQTPTGTRGLPILSVLITISTWLAIAFGAFLTILLIIYIVYRSLYKGRDDVSFQQFLTRNTDSESGDSQDVGSLQDILGEIEKPEKNDILSFPKEEASSEKNDVLATSSKDNTSGDTVSPEQKIEEVPDWLKGSFTNPQSKEDFSEKNTFGEKGNDTQVVDTKGDTDRSSKKSEDTLKASSQMTGNTQKQIGEDFEKDALPEDSQVPDWLKGSYDIQQGDDNIFNEDSIEESNIKESSKKEVIPDKDNTSQGEKIINNSQDTPHISGDTQEGGKSTFESNNMTEKDIETEEELNIPDWLKGSLDTSEKNDTSFTDDISKNKKGQNKTGNKDGTQIDQDSGDKKQDIKISSASMAPTRKQRNAKTQATLTEKKSLSNQKKNDIIKKGELSISEENNTTDQAEELWDDGMKIPDWLKSSDDDTSSNK